MVVDPDEAVTVDEDEGGLLDRVKSYYRTVFSPAQY